MYFVCYVYQDLRKCILFVMYTRTYVNVFCLLCIVYFKSSMLNFQKTKVFTDHK